MQGKNTADKTTQETADNHMRRFEVTAQKLTNKNIAVIGNSGSGKSVLVRHLAYFLRDIPISAAICTGPKTKMFYGAFMPKHHIIDGGQINDEMLWGFMRAREQNGQLYVDVWEEIRNNLVKNIEAGYMQLSLRRVMAIVDRIVENGHVLFEKDKIDTNILLAVRESLITAERSAPTEARRRLVAAKRHIAFSDQRSLLIFDDLMGEDWFKDKQGSAIYNMLSRGRHVYITAFYILQSYSNSGLASHAKAAYHVVIVMGNMAAYGSLRDNTLRRMLTARTALFNKRLGSVVTDILSMKGGAIIFEQDKPSTRVFEVLYYYIVHKKYARMPPPFRFREAAPIIDMSLMSSSN